MSEGRWRTVRVATYNIHRCRGLDGRTRPDRTAAVLAVARRRHPRAAGGDRRRAGRPRARGGARRGARHGLGDGVRRGSCAARCSATWCSAGFRSGTTRSTTCRGRRASRAAASASTWISTARCCTSTTCTSARRSSNAAFRRSASRHRERPPRPRREGGARRLQRVDARAGDDAPVERLQASTCARTCGAGGPIPGLFPILHLDHIYYEGHVEVAAWSSPARGRR